MCRIYLQATASEMLLFQTHYQQGLTHVLQQLMLVSC